MSLKSASNFVVNVVVFAACLLTCWETASRFGWFGQFTRPPVKSKAKGPKAGDRFPLAGQDWHQSQTTVILALARGCRFCAASAAFYRKLLDEFHAPAISMLAVTEEPEGQAQSYLSELQIKITDVRQADFAVAGVTGTPTLIVVNRDGIVQQSWVGLLTEDRQKEVISYLSKLQAAHVSSRARSSRNASIFSDVSLGSQCRNEFDGIHDFSWYVLAKSKQHDLQSIQIRRKVV